MGAVVEETRRAQRLVKQLEQASTLADQKEEALAAATQLQDERDALRWQTVEMQRRMDDLEAKIKQAAEGEESLAEIVQPTPNPC